MKKNLILLGAAAALIITPAFSLRADDNVQAKKQTRAHTTKVTKATAMAHPNREYIFITNQAVTGSHIPVTVTRYHGHNTTSSPLVSYDQTDISETGSLDVGSALRERDPAITFGRGR